MVSEPAYQYDYAFRAALSLDIKPRFQVGENRQNSFGIMGLFMRKGRGIKHRLSTLEVEQNTVGNPLKLSDGQNL